MAVRVQKSTALADVRCAKHYRIESTHKKIIPPREKNAVVSSGAFKKTDPMMMAWKTYELQ